jgi:hypothetical protein
LRMEPQHRRNLVLGCGCVGTGDIRTGRGDAPFEVNAEVAVPCKMHQRMAEQARRESGR